jgi:hypothetical protein
VRQSPRGLCRRLRTIFTKTYTRKTSSPAMTRQELEALIDEERTIAATGGTFDLGVRSPCGSGRLGGGAFLYSERPAGAVGNGVSSKRDGSANAVSRSIGWKSDVP